MNNLWKINKNKYKSQIKNKKSKFKDKLIGNRHSQHYVHQEIQNLNQIIKV